MGGAAISFNINIMDHWFAPQLVSPNTSENQLSMHMAQVDPHAGLLAQARPAFNPADGQLASGWKG